MPTHLKREFLLALDRPSLVGSSVSWIEGYEKWRC
uniref:Uncharacterized protein n=1 Tax=Rhizophora mucronata TaxID=61149 RepID=A0A2P2N6C3_RHIMU